VTYLVPCSDAFQSAKFEVISIKAWLDSFAVLLGVEADYTDNSSGYPVNGRSLELAPFRLG